MRRTLCTLVLGGFLSLSSCTSVVHLPPAPLHDHEGKKIQFIQQPGHPWGAASNYDQYNKPYIVYNPAWLGTFPEEFQTFLIYHELGHLVLGHTDQNPYTRTEKQLIKIQLEADCYSIKHLRDELNYSVEQFSVISDWGYLVFEEKERIKNLTKCLQTK